jgi:hypothetical protein
VQIKGALKPFAVPGDSEVGFPQQQAIGLQTLIWERLILERETTWRLIQDSQVKSSRTIMLCWRRFLEPVSSNLGLMKERQGRARAQTKGSEYFASTHSLLSHHKQLHFHTTHPTKVSGDLFADGKLRGPFAGAPSTSFFFSFHCLLFIWDGCFSIGG